MKNTAIEVTQVTNVYTSHNLYILKLRIKILLERAGGSFLLAIRSVWHF